MKTHGRARQIPGRDGFTPAGIEEQAAKGVPREVVILNGMVKAVPPEVTYKDFAILAKQQGWTPEFLANKFRGIIEGPSEFFHRCLNGKPTWDVVIPYRSILDFYWTHLNPMIENESVRVCACGCGRRVYGRKQYATGYCRKKMSLQRARTGETVAKKPAKNKDFPVTFSKSRSRSAQVTVYQPARHKGEDYERQQ